jgi:hypothetical protein
LLLQLLRCAPKANASGWGGVNIVKARWADAWADALANAWADAAENRPRPGIILLIKSEVQILMYTQLSSYFFLFFFCPASLGDSQTRAFSWWARIQTSEKITVSTAQLLLGRSNYMYMMMDTLVDDVSRVDLRFHACRIQWRS